MKCGREGYPGIVFRPSAQDRGRQAGQCVCAILFSGSSWIVTAAHCLYRPLNPEDPTVYNSYLLSPSDFKVIVGE